MHPNHHNGSGINPTPGQLHQWTKSIEAADLQHPVQEISIKQTSNKDKEYCVSPNRRYPSSNKASQTVQLREEPSPSSNKWRQQSPKSGVKIRGEIKTPEHSRQKNSSITPESDWRI
ncbi:hypothetical protein Nepgr_022974 [Nepenthes gracilis]|uniref:Uncharacterized protein n=1 Tax=Nepenthes gracilis TaxID=150966 RepID=A0AAD3XXA8_NEPGR|nr:hypothetical protein Nepgr_022974 [Nepenthes gracilis]